MLLSLILQADNLSAGPAASRLFKEHESLVVSSCGAVLFVCGTYFIIQDVLTPTGIRYPLGVLTGGISCVLVSTAVDAGLEDYPRNQLVLLQDTLRRRLHVEHSEMNLSKKINNAACSSKKSIKKLIKK